MKTIRFVLVLLIGLSFFGCSNDDKSKAEKAKKNVAIAALLAIQDISTGTVGKNVVILDTETLNSISYSSESYDTIQFAKKTNQLDTIQKDTILIGGENPITTESFMLRTISFDKNTLELKADPIPIEDAFEELKVDYSSDTPEEVNNVSPDVKLSIVKSDVNQASGTYEISFNKTIHLENGVSVTGSIYVKPSYNLKIDVNKYRLQYFKFSSKIPSTQKLTVNTEIASIHRHYEKDLLTINFPPIPIGGTPFMIRPKAKLRLVIDVDGSLGIQTGVTQETTFDVGLEYVRGRGWTKWGNANRNLTYQAPTLVGKGDLSINLGPRIELNIMKRIGVYTNIFGKASADVELTQYGDIAYSLSGGYRLDLGVSANLFGWEIGYDATGLIEYNKELYKGKLVSAPIIYGVSVSDIKEASAVVTTKLNRPSTVRVNYGTSQTNLSMIKENGFPNTNQSLTLTDLVPETTYYYQVTATAEGKSTKSTVMSFKTPKAKNLIRIISGNVLYLYNEKTKEKTIKADTVNYSDWAINLQLCKPDGSKLKYGGKLYIYDQLGNLIKSHNFAGVVLRSHWDILSSKLESTI